MSIAVLDFGKTNTKLLVFDPQGNVLFSARTRPAWRNVDGIEVLDDAALGDWAMGALRSAEAACPGAMLGVMVSAHGCTFALASETGLIRPILDYEQELPGDLGGAVDAALPPYAETFAPPRPQGFNYGRHMLWLRHLEPDSFARATAILGYPQFWSWRLGGRQVAETSYMGCHSHIWAPAKGDFSSLVDQQAWRDKMPEFARAGVVIGEVDLGGRAIAVHNGVHDSNAALQAYRSLGLDSFTLISTGTWVIIFNPDCPLEALDPVFDMYCNTDVDRRAVPTIGFMGGREFDAIAGAVDEPVDRESIQRAIDARAFALPAFAAAGPFGGWPGKVPEAGDRAAIAMLYVALMIDWCLDTIQSKNAIVIDGGLTAGGVLGGLVAQLRGDQAVSEGAIREGTAAGAAALAFAAIGIDMELPHPVPVASESYRDLDAYRSAWRSQLPDLGGRAKTGS